MSPSLSAAYLEIPSVPSYIKAEASESIFPLLIAYIRRIVILDPLVRLRELHMSGERTIPLLRQQSRLHDRVSHPVGNLRLQPLSSEHHLFFRAV